MILLVLVLLVFCLISAFTTYTLGIFVFAKKPAAPVNQLFLVMMLVSACWAGGEFLIWQSGSAEEMAFWLRACSFWPFVIALAVHFILLFTRHPISDRKHLPILLGVLYLPAALITLAGVFTGALYTVAYAPGTGLYYLPARGSPVYIAETLYNLLLMLFAVYISISALLRAAPGRVRRQYWLVSAGLAAVIACGAFSAVVLPASAIFVPNLVFSGFVVFSLLIAYAILRYGLFSVTPETAVPDILRLMPDGVVLTGMDGRVLTANASAAAILGEAGGTLSGRDLRSLLPETACASLFSAIRERGNLPDLEVDLAGDSAAVVSIAASRVLDPDGEPAGLVLIIRDITTRKASERALMVAHDKISLLTRLTRHDIGNIVTALWGYLELLKDNRSGPESDDYIAQSIDLVEKISNHLRYSREMQDACTYTPAWQPLAPMVDQALRELPHGGITITTGIAPVEVLADPMAVRVIYNILENAIRHGERLTQISLTTRELPGGALLVTVSDDGVGVRDEDKERIFRNGFGKNTGLGLALSRDILSLTGISIRETGTAGQGARFELLVPKGGWRPVPVASPGSLQG